MHLVQVDVVGAQPSQACVHGRDDVLTPCAMVVRAATGRPEALRGDDQLVTGPSGQPAADDLLGRTAAVHIGGVDEIAAGIDVPVEQ
ncbi:hypothetical protein BJY16_007498 [Actinoplanes octamycinicus]|uniref:Uncharacterized protein n=1 Tax=Actinoplanes octamycinicus TaxID=135948 RepID=A0A7W7H4Y2_9ACTN|nr:hypothetical protein [Actinoplanes octamycinicus]